MKFLTAADILARPDKIETKELQTAGGAVNIKRLSPADNEKLAAFYIAHTADGMVKYSRADYQSLMMALVVVGEDGKTPIFTDEDLKLLKTKDVDLWEDIWAAVESSNPLGTKAEVKAAKKN